MGRAVSLGTMLLLFAGCGAAPAPPVPSAAPSSPPQSDASDATVPPTSAGVPTGVACGGPLEPAVTGRVRLRPDPALTATLGAPAALGLRLLGEGGGPEACGDQVVLGPAEDAAARTLAATTAAVRGAPLLLLSGRSVDVDALPAATRTVITRRLDRDGAVTREVVTAATPAEHLDASLALHEQLAPSGRGATSIVLVAATDVAMQAELVADAAGGAWPLVVTTDVGDAADLGGLAGSLASRAPDLAIRWAASDDDAADALRAVGVEELGAERWVPDDPSAPTELWLGDVRAPGLALTAAAVASVRGAAFVAVDGADLRSGAERTTRIRAVAAGLPADGVVVLVGGGADADWQLDTVIEGTPLPGGGFLPLEDRRIVALYGSPGAPPLGILGEQDLEATIARAREFAAGYEDAADGRIVVPGFDVIATVASSGPEPTGDYSRRVPIERLRPLVERAGEEGMAVILDLQSGRTDFLTQAREYEELLLLPHVHLALDPEWRIGPTERHLQRIGSVEAAEVQQVADWLAALVRRELLPQKVLMLHQFVLTMLPDRDTVVVPPELVGVVHVDGQGPLPTKDRTYAAMTDGAEERWAWGWKNFTRIDEPMATPERTLDRTPVPLVVTYQ